MCSLPWRRGQSGTSRMKMSWQFEKWAQVAEMNYTHFLRPAWGQKDQRQLCQGEMRNCFRYATRFGFWHIGSCMLTTVHLYFHLHPWKPAVTHMFIRNGSRYDQHDRGRATLAKTFLVINRHSCIIAFLDISVCHYFRLKFPEIFKCFLFLWCSYLDFSISLFLCFYTKIHFFFYFFTEILQRNRNRKNKNLDTNENEI